MLDYVSLIDKNTFVLMHCDIKAYRGMECRTLLVINTCVILRLVLRASKPVFAVCGCKSFLKLDILLS